MTSLGGANGSDRVVGLTGDDSAVDEQERPELDVGNCGTWVY